MNEHLMERVGRRSRQQTNHQQARQIRGFPGRANAAIAAYFAQEASLRADTTEEWTTRGDLPTIQELCELQLFDAHDTGPGAIKHHTLSDFEIHDEDAMRLDEPFPSKEQYLKAVYRLLRADALLPWSKLYNHFMSDHSIIEDDQSADYGIYDNVKVVGLTFDSLGLAIRVQFTLDRVGKMIAWQQTKRLTTGGLVLLFNKSSPSKKPATIATVASHSQDLLKLNPPEVDLFIAHPSDFDFSVGATWVMCESRSSYWEAYRHVLKAIQHKTIEEFPLKRYLVDLKPDIAIAPSIKAAPNTDLRSIFPDETTRPMYHINVVEDWPSDADIETSFDTSQLEAVQRAVTKDLCLIQGPPGCGKTFVSIAAIKCHLARHCPTDPPIIIACQTNHALDQFLRHLSQFEPDFVRLGSRSKDEIVKQRTLHALKDQASSWKQKLPYSTLLASTRRSLNSLYSKLERIVEPLLVTDDLPSLELLVSTNVIRQDQADSLERTADQWTMDTSTSVDHPLRKWVGKSLTKVSWRIPEQQYSFARKFEEADAEVELEELDEDEAERPIFSANNEEDEMFDRLTGAYSTFGDVWRAFGTSISKAQIIHELERNKDLTKIRPALRGSIFNYMMDQLRRVITESFKLEAQAYFELIEKVRIGRLEQDEMIIRAMGIKVIGLTTTRLSRDRALIAALGPKVILIEEAGELLEAPVCASIVPSIEQLILVGDHQQLRPHTVTRDLAQPPWNLNISMFERLVGLSIEHSFLSMQRRMKKSIARLLQPIYGDRLQNHPCVESRPKIPGMGNVATYFLHHTQPEAFDSQFSAYNEFECRMIIGFVDYLIKNKLPPEKITVITFYNGQRRRLARSIRLHPGLSKYLGIIRISTIDSYQGEENLVVILSLVRSNEAGRIGFLDVVNRVCVALSRAQAGFYVFGNSRLLSRNSEIWSDVVGIMRGSPFTNVPSRHGMALPLTCHNHGNVMEYSDPAQLSTNDGGCHVKCEVMLKCGHVCAKRCHPSPHEALCNTCAAAKESSQVRSRSVQPVLQQPGSMPLGERRSIRSALSSTPPRRFYSITIAEPPLSLARAPQNFIMRANGVNAPAHELMEANNTTMNPTEVARNGTYTASQANKAAANGVERPVTAIEILDTRSPVSPSAKPARVFVNETPLFDENDDLTGAHKQKQDSEENETPSWSEIKDDEDLISFD